MGPKNSSWRRRCLPDFPNLDSSPDHSFADIGREVAELTGRLPPNLRRLEMEPKLPCDRTRRHIGFRRKLFVDRCYTHDSCLSSSPRLPNPAGQSRQSMPPVITVSESNRALQHGEIKELWQVQRSSWITLECRPRLRSRHASPSRLIGASVHYIIAVSASVTLAGIALIITTIGVLKGSASRLYIQASGALLILVLTF